MRNLSLWRRLVLRPINWVSLASVIRLMSSLSPLGIVTDGIAPLTKQATPASDLSPFDLLYPDRKLRHQPHPYRSHHLPVKFRPPSLLLDQVRDLLPDGPLHRPLLRLLRLSFQALSTLSPLQGRARAIVKFEQDLPLRLKQDHPELEFPSPFPIPLHPLKPPFDLLHLLLHHPFALEPLSLLLMFHPPLKTSLPRRNQPLLLPFVLLHDPTRPVTYRLHRL